MMRYRRITMMILCRTLCAGCASAPKAQAPSAATSTTPAATTTSAPQALTPLAEINARLDNATAIAQAGGDTAGAACWPAVKAWVATLPVPPAAAVMSSTLPDPTGASGEYETLRIKDQLLKAQAAQVKLYIASVNAAIINGLPTAVNNACAPLVVDFVALQTKIIGLLGLVPQTGIAAAGAAGVGTAAATLKALQP